ncbi:MAG TPA: lysophospholipid acyltransferase family protein [Myxococcaceae bacterium]|nr:lysophospholipid acyltransferase family protein [Myxococcaceae bacterium]
MKLLVNVLFWSIFAVTAPLGVVIGFLLAATTAPFDADRRLIHSFICRFVFSYLRLNPLWQVRVEGRERISDRPSVLVANHQSMADIVACMGLFRQYKFVSKVSLFSLPLVGWMMRLAKYVRLERGSVRSTQQMLDQCRFWLRRGISVLFFPEGTYGTGGELLPFKRGAFLLAIQERVPLIPVLIEGTPSLVFEDGPWFNPRCAIRVSVLPPIEPGQLGDSEGELAQRVRVLFEQGLRHSSGADTRYTG